MFVAAIASATFSLQALAQVVSLSNATISPDATHVAFVVSRADQAHNRYDDTLEFLVLPSKALVALGGHRSVGNLAWSPDGLHLAAVMDDRNGTDQLFLIDVKTKKTSQLTHGDQDVIQIAWDSDGSRLAFTRQDRAPAKVGAAPYEDGFRVDDNAYLVESQARPNHIWMVDVRGREQRMTTGPLSAMNDQLSWSPNGRYILWERGPATHGLRDRAVAVRLDVITKTIANATGQQAHESQAVFSPDARHIAYIAPQRGDPANQDDAFVGMEGTPGATDVSLARDRNVSTLAWMPGGKALLEQIDDRAEAPLVEQHLDGTSRRLSLGSVVAAGIQPEGSIARDGTIAFIGDQMLQPDEVYVLGPKDRAPRRLTFFNNATSHLKLGRVERIAWRSPAGFDEDGVLTYPPGFERNRRYPLVLRIHGGPYESSTIAFSSFYQLAASHGYLVFAPNYRGSTDLGNAYERAIIDDPNVGPSDDIIGGIAAVEQLGSVDSRRIAVSGWSYGGQLTSWLEGHYHFWRAAVAGAAVNDLVVDYSTADDIDADRLMFAQSSPFRGQSLSLWREQSPLSSFKDIRTPTLIFCNVYDVRVPIVESYEMFHALEDNGVAVKFYAYPTGGHLPQGPVREADVYRRWLSWFDDYLKPVRRL